MDNTAHYIVLGLKYGTTTSVLELLVELALFRQLAGDTGELWHLTLLTSDVCVALQPLEHVAVAARRSVALGVARPLERTLLVQPHDDVQVAIRRGVVDPHGRAAFVAARMQPLDDIQVALGGRPVHRLGRAAFVAVRVQPPDDVQVAVACRAVHGARRAAFAAVRMEPLDDVEASVPRGLIHRSHRRAVERAVGFVQPLQDAQVTVLRRSVKCPRLVLALWERLVQPLDDVQVAICSGSFDRELYSVRLAATETRGRAHRIYALQQREVARGCCAPELVAGRRVSVSTDGRGDVRKSSDGVVLAAQDGDAREQEAVVRGRRHRV